jgi:hypothetical protein
MNLFLEYLASPLFVLVFNDGEPITIINRASSWILFSVLVYGVDWAGIIS